MGARLAEIIPEAVRGVEDCGGFVVGLLADLEDCGVDFPGLAGLIFGGVSKSKPVSKWTFVVPHPMAKQ